MKKIFYLINNYFVLLVIATVISITFTVGIILNDPNSINEITLIILPEQVLNVAGASANKPSRSIDINKSIYNGFTFDLKLTDYRALVFEKYIEMNNSPLQGLGQDFIIACKKYNAPKDCTVVLAIAKAETDLCNYPPSQFQQNCWGFGGSGENRYIFNSYKEGIDLVTERLVNSYGLEYMIDPDAMEMTFCGQRPSCEEWGERVQQFMDELNVLSIQMGYPSLYSLRNN